MDDSGIIIGEENTIQEVREWLSKEEDYQPDYLIVSNIDGEYKGILSSTKLLSKNHILVNRIGTLTTHSNIHIKSNDTLRIAVETMARENIDVLPVISNKNKEIIGVLSYRDILATYKYNLEEHLKKQPNVSLKRRGLKIVLRGKKIRAKMKWRDK